MVSLRGVVVFLALVSVGALAETSLEQQAEQIIEDFRKIMPTGAPAMGIPALEPVVIPEVPLTIKISPFNAKCLATDIQVAGVSGFKFTKIHQEDGNTKLDVAVELPDIDVTGQYDLNGKVKVSLVNIKLKGKGPLKATLKGLKGAATADVIVNSDGTLNLKSLKVDSWTYKKISIKLENLLGGGVMGNTVNGLINDLVPSFIKSNRAKLNTILETTGLTVINQYLDGIKGVSSNVYVPQTLLLDEESWVVTDEMKNIMEQIAFAAARMGSKKSSIIN